MRQGAPRAALDPRQDPCFSSPASPQLLEGVGCGGTAWGDGEGATGDPCALLRFPRPHGAPTHLSVSRAGTGPPGCVILAGISHLFPGRRREEAVRSPGRGVRRPGLTSGPPFPTC